MSKEEFYEKLHSLGFDDEKCETYEKIANYEVLELYDRNMIKKEDIESHISVMRNLIAKVL